MYLKIISSLLLAVLLLQQPAFAGLGSKKAQYVGGTLTIREGAQGFLSTADTERLIFKGDKGEAFSAPYAKVTSLAYGQHAGRRVGATIAWGITTLGIGALPILFSKKRRHYLTVSFTNDAGKEEAAVFQLGKNVIRTTLAALQARTGKKVEYEDDEARKSGNK